VSRCGRAVSPVRGPDRRGREAVLPAGDEWAYIAGIVAILLGAALIFFLFPRKDREEELLARYHAEDVAEPAKPPAPAAPALR